VRRGWRIAGWVFLGLTSIATVYLGWHFFVDSLGGVVVGVVAVWVAALGTGNHVGWRPRLVRDEAPSPVRSSQPVRR
jgi:membrane-associated phospholipid phosphatase